MGTGNNAYADGASCAGVCADLVPVSDMEMASQNDIDIHSCLDANHGLGGGGVLCGLQQCEGAWGEGVQVQLL